MKIRGKRVAARVARDGLNAEVMTLEWKAVLRTDPCVFCGERGDIEFEHITPRKRGGKNDWTNIAAACKAHNTMKADLPLWWMLWRLNEQRLGFTRQRVVARRGGRPVKWMTVYTRMQRPVKSGRPEV